MEVIVFFAFFLYMMGRAVTIRSVTDYIFAVAFLLVTGLTFCMEDSRHSKLCRGIGAVISLGCFGTVWYQYAHNVFADTGLVCLMVFWGMAVFQALLPEKPCKISGETV